MTVVPVTSNVARVYPFQTPLPAVRTGLRVDSKAQAEEIRTASIARLGSVLGRLTPGMIDELDGALRVHLEL